nr:deoxyribose-phosphate aldolase [Sphingomonas colocasiae]
MDADADLRLAVSCIDLTTLRGDDTEPRVRALCERAISAGVAAVCVHPVMVPTAVEALAGSRIAIASVAAGFPHGLSPLATRIAEIEAAVADGATEIDIVIRRGHALAGDWQALHQEVAAFRATCGPAHLKAILATGELADATMIARAAHVCIAAGADFIKTSTGFETVNATLPAGAAMLSAIRDWHRETGERIGFKAAGGIATASQALEWITLVHAMLGEDWLTPALFRIGASRLLDDILARHGD